MYMSIVTLYLLHSLHGCYRAVEELWKCASSYAKNSIKQKINSIAHSVSYNAGEKLSIVVLFKLPFIAYILISSRFKVLKIIIPQHLTVSLNDFSEQGLDARLKYLLAHKGVHLILFLNVTQKYFDLSLLLH